MAGRYAKDQPQGFTNRIEKVAIVGVRLPPLEYHHVLTDDAIGRRTVWKALGGSFVEDWQTPSDGNHAH
jgi:hypothetical protein